MALLVSLLVLCSYFAATTAAPPTADDVVVTLDHKVHNYDQKHQFYDKRRGLEYEVYFNDRKLVAPVLKLCERRRTPTVWTRVEDGLFYTASWNYPENRRPGDTGNFNSKNFTWFQARNECRKRCMETVSLTSEVENTMVADIMRAGLGPVIWTSGRRCDTYHCTDESLKPHIVNGWYWAGEGVKIAPSYSKPEGWSKNPWSNTGFLGKLQPDNAEVVSKLPGAHSESCLVVMNNAYQDGVKWHDISCRNKGFFICQDSEELLAYIEETHGVKLERS